MKIFTAAGVGSLALGISTATSLAGEPIIMGTQRIAPDPGQRPRLDERLDQGAARATSSNPIRDESGMSLWYVPAPVVAPSKRSQNARDEKANWMMLNRGDLTDTAHTGNLFGNDSMLPDAGSGRRDYFFEKTDGRGSLNGRQPLSDKALDLVNRPGQAMNNSAGALSRHDEEKSRRTDTARDRTGGTPDGRKSLDEPGLGPLMNPGRISGAEGIERWSSSINQALQRRKVNGVNDTQIRREQYLDYLGSANYSGANYPANTAWDKYQREWDGSAAGRGASGPGLSGTLPGKAISSSAGKPMTPAGGGLSPAGLGASGGVQGNLPGMGTLPSSLQAGSAPGSRPKVDYSVPKDPASSFDFK